jgi:hypothetical protein
MVLWVTLDIKTYNLPRSLILMVEFSNQGMILDSKKP